MYKIQTFKDLFAWQKGHELVLLLYRLEKNFPRHEQFALSSQIKRACVSVTSNIAEGFSRQTLKDKRNFYHIALGSCTEVQDQLTIALDLGYVTQVEFDHADRLSVEVHKLLNGLIKSIKD